MAQDMTIKRSTYNKLLAAVVVLAVAFSFSAGYMLGGSSGSTVGGTITQQIPSQQPESNARAQVSVDDDPQMGSPSAPVTMIEFSDFECPFCGQFFQASEGQLIAEYVNTGKVRFVYRDFPLSFHPQAEPAALAAECAYEQGKFWEYHDQIFNNQNLMSIANFKAWAADLGLNTVQFNDCLDSRKYLSDVQKDFQDGNNAGVSGTPTFFIGSPERGYQQVVGAQPYAVIKQVIEQELAG